MSFFTGIAILLASVFATIGWWWTSRTQQVTARRHHTFNIFLEYRFKGGIAIAIDRLAEITDADNIPSPKDNTRKDDVAFIDQLLDHYEFVSAAILNGDLDEQLFKSCDCSMIVRLPEKLKDYINKSQQGQETVYANLIALSNRWRFQQPTIIERIYEYFMFRPCLELPRWLKPVDYVSKKLKIDKFIKWAGFISQW